MYQAADNMVHLEGLRFSDISDVRRDLNCSKHPIFPSLLYRVTLIKKTKDLDHKILSLPVMCVADATPNGKVQNVTTLTMNTNGVNASQNERW